MPVFFSRRGVLVRGAGPGPRALRFMDTVLRGMGQVMLQCNSRTGALFVLGLLVASPPIAAAAVLGSAVGTLTALALGASRHAVRRGLHGFNGALTGAALLLLMPLHPWLAWTCVVLGAAVATLCMMTLGPVLRRGQLSALTAPFVLAAWAFLLVAGTRDPVPSSELLPAAASAFGLGAGLLNGVAQVFLQAGALTGLLFLAGLCLSSGRVATAALLGSALGLGVGWLLGATEPALRDGLYGFNSTLVAIALAGHPAAPRRPLLRALVAAAVTPVAYAALTALLQPMGLPALTLPFVLVTWLFVILGRRPPSLPGRDLRAKMAAHTRESP